MIKVLPRSEIIKLIWYFARFVVPLHAIRKKVNCKSSNCKLIKAIYIVNGKKIVVK